MVVIAAMGPVSFEPIARGLERTEALRLAALLTAAGIRARITDGGSTILVGSADASRSRELLADQPPSSETPDRPD